MLGRKTGQGWYRYPPGPPPLPSPPAAQSKALPLPIIIGPNPLAKELRARFQHTENVAEARFVLDCRVLLERKHDFFREPASGLAGLGAFRQLHAGRVPGPGRGGV